MMNVETACNVKLLKISLLSIFILCYTNAYSQKKVLSSRWFHPTNNLDTLSTVQIINLLKPDRIDWTYTEDKNITTIYKKLGIPFSLTINPQYPDSAEQTSVRSRIRDINGEIYIAPWMKGWKISNPYWGCVNNPEFINLFNKKVIELINLGAYAVFIDDALFNVQLQNNKPNKHGCFCKYCTKLFLDKQTLTIRKGGDDLFKKNILKNTGLLKDYEAFQRQSVVSFLNNVRTILKDRRAKLLVNNPNGNWNDIYRISDGGIAELTIKNLNVAYLAKAFEQSRILGKSQVFSLSSEDYEAQEYLIAYCYLNKLDYLIPWDIYIKDQKRFYMDLNRLKDFLDKLSRSQILIKNNQTIINNNFSLTKTNKWYATYSSGEQQIILLNSNKEL